MSFQVTNGRFQALLAGGAPIVGGRLYTYVSGTTTFKATYTDSTLATPNTYTADGSGGQYIALNARGEAHCWLGTGSYSLVLKDAAGVTVWSEDGLSDPASVAVQLSTDLAASGGSALVGFIQAGSGAVARTIQAKARERVSLEDFGAVADWNGTSGTDNLTALNNAIAAVATFGGVVELGYGRFLISAAPTLTALKHITIRGKGSAESDNDIASTELVIASGALTIESPNVRLEKLVLRGKAGHTGNLVQVGTATGGTTANSFAAVDVGFFTAGQDGLRIGHDSGTNANNFYLENCRFFNNGRHGLYISDDTYPAPPDANAGTIVHCVSQHNASDGIRFGNAWVNTVVGGVYELNSGCGARMLQGSKYNKITGGDFEQNSGTADISIESVNAVFNSVDVNAVNFASINDTGSLTQINAPDLSSTPGFIQKGVYRMYMAHNGGSNDIISGTASGTLRLIQGDDAINDANAQLYVSAIGTRLGKSTGGKVGFFDATPVAKINTSIGAGTFVDSGATAVHTASTFEGYTIGQVIVALRNYGLLA
jgi:hypothetical protein